jgi:Flp pilus assembly protein TadB
MASAEKWEQAGWVNSADLYRRLALDELNQDAITAAVDEFAAAPPPEVDCDCDCEACTPVEEEPDDETAAGFGWAFGLLIITSSISLLCVLLVAAWCWHHPLQAFIAAGVLGVAAGVRRWLGARA